MYQFVYNLERHRLLNMPLHRWLILVCLIVPVTMWSQVWKVNRLTAILLTLGALSILVGMWWAQRRNYVRFVEHAAQGRPQAATQEPSQSPLPPMQKVNLHATGFFEVSGMQRYLVETPADYTTFETREHCVMTQVPRSRFVLLGKSSQQEIGWWYAFFQPSMIKAVTSGCLHFGLHPRPAVRLEIAEPDHAEDEVLYLSFDDEAIRSVVLADLQYDADVA